MRNILRLKASIKVPPETPLWCASVKKSKSREKKEKMSETLGVNPLATLLASLVVPLARKTNANDLERVVYWEPSTVLEERKPRCSEVVPWSFFSR